MNTLRVTSQKTGSLTKHVDVRLRKIRSLKTSVLKPLKTVAAAKNPNPKPSIKSIVPYGLVFAALMLSGVTASEAHAATHAKVSKPAHAVTHVVRRREQGGYDPSEWSTPDPSPPVDNSAQQAADQASAMAAMQQQQAVDEMNASNAAAAAQAALDTQNTLQYELNNQ